MMNLSTSTTGNINSLRLLWSGPSEKAATGCFFSRPLNSSGPLVGRALRLVDDSVGALLQEAPLPRSLIWGKSHPYPTASKFFPV